MTAGRYGTRRIRLLRSTVRTSEDAALLCRMAAWAVLLPMLKHIVGLDRLARLAWAEPKTVAAPETSSKVLALSRLLSLPRSRGTCYERGLLVYRFLARSGQDPRLVVAVTKREGRFDAHAWVTVGGKPVGESRAIEQYKPIVAYGRGGRRETVPGASLAEA